MAVVAVQTSTRLVHETCCSCGVLFGLEDGMRNQRIRDHKTFYCPNGHPQSYTGDTEKERLRKENERLQSQLVIERRTHDTAIRGERIKRGKAEAAKTRIEQRVHAGICPHCNRTFQQLARHMASKHAEHLPHTHGSLPK